MRYRRAGGGGEVGVRLIDGERIYSATDLTNFLACPHLSALALGRLEGRVDEPPPRVASTADLAVEKGIEHERLYLEQMRELHGDQLVSVEAGAGGEQLHAAVAATSAAMHDGAPLIYQAAFLSDGWMGYADFLERVDTRSDLGAWSYRPLDTKLARAVKPYFVIQLSLYGELIAAVQGSIPERLELILGDGERRSLASSDFRAYFERMKGRFLTAVDQGLDGTYPEPVDHCELCDWADPCEERRVADDHLSQVAKLGRAQGEKLVAAGIETVAELAIAGAERRPAGMATETFEKLHSQAELQVGERESGEHRLVLLEPEPVGQGPPRGFGLLPAPSPGDLFFDIEGDPFFDEGLEYLWGVTYLEDGRPRFRAFWGLDHAAEKRAFEEFVDFVFERRRRFPDLHVYHYATYERTALGRLMGKYATREEEVDSLFRERVLVDLYRVVEQSMQISRPSYSLKQVEDFYGQGRQAEVKQAGDSVLMFGRWREDGDPGLLTAIESYNKEDCDSTLALREWLLEQRHLCESLHAVEIPPRALGEPDAGAEASLQESTETAALQERLLAEVPDDPAERSSEQADRWLLAQILDHHRREAKPAWWRYFDRLEASDDELTNSDSEALGGLRREGRPQAMPPPARSSLQRFSFPAQEHKIGPGEVKDPHSCGIDPLTGESDLRPKGVEVVEVDDRSGTLTLKLSKARLAEDQTALVPGGPYSTPLQRAALQDLAMAVIEAGLDQIPRYRAARDILCTAFPRTAAVAYGEPLQGEHADHRQIKAIAAGLEDSYLFIQGPPGSGKTYTGAEVILELIAAGHKVGVSANSHKAINNLLAEVESQASPGTAGLRGCKKSSEPEHCFEPVAPTGEQTLIVNSKKNEDFAPGHDFDLIAGTAWLWCREEMRESVDYLVIDEAGQISLADALAMATAARNVILLGDPLQLAQVSQGTHPPGSGASVLEHLLGTETTVPPRRGIFLEQTRRMHPDVCRFVSAAIYEGRLGWEPSCERQRILADGRLTGTGVRSIPVLHTGNSRRSPEEAEAIVAAIESLGGATFTDREGTTSDLEAGQIMVVTPYNAQVRCLRQTLEGRGLGEVAVGTVDKFQGQEAAVVFFSMATSSGAEIPRNVEFLYSRNRLNVAVSRAQCLAVLVASPELMSIECRSVEQMRLVNALCLLDEMGRSADVETETGG
jgi:predicted RecB family nuclease